MTDRKNDRKGGLEKLSALLDGGTTIMTEGVARIYLFVSPKFVGRAVHIPDLKCPCCHSGGTLIMQGACAVCDQPFMAAFCASRSMTDIDDKSDSVSFNIDTMLCDGCRILTKTARRRAGAREN